ncbi:hypothetical protein QFC22_003452 [Naganishia vaughanmartiniae]|uniref:Uncharacterized protein n=1 Tax=Naganishia vaughanmartiniae TaxID=1424756 RepID=A0ACC2X8Z3_9TREE|nr:hypothetical protein QFC22_003452 [Naganishia vaughanmartiniae]
MFDLDFLNAILARPAQHAAPPSHPNASTVPNDTDLPPNDTTANDYPDNLGTTGVPQDILRSLEGLSTEERAAFAPLLQALSSAPSGTSNSGPPGQEISIKDVQDMLKQFDAADSVADTLEGKLDKLLESLGEVEDAFPEEQDPKKRGSSIGGPKAGKGVGPQQLPETMAGEAKQAFEAVAKDRD